MKFLSGPLAWATAWPLTWTLALVLLTGPGTPPARAADARSPLSILVLYDENRDLPGLSVIDRSLKARFSAGWASKIEFYTESLDLARFHRKEYEQFLRETFRRKYSGKKLDLIVAVMGPSLQFLLRYGKEIFPGAPVVFCGVDLRELAGRRLPPHVTGVLVHRVFRPTLDLALRLQPDTRGVVLIGGTSGFDRFWAAQARRELRPFKNQLHFTDAVGAKMSDILRRVAELPPHTVILYVTLFRDGAGQSFVPHEAAAQIAQRANAPVYAFTDQYLGRGIVGGHLYSVETQGIRAAELGLRILAGVKPASIPLLSEGTHLDLFDARALERWEIDERRLPSDAVVRFRPVSFWRVYGGYIAAMGAVCTVEALLIWGLLMQCNRRQRVEAALRESQARYRASYEQIQDLAGRLMTAQEAERSRIGRELHDDVGQQFAALSIAHSLLRRHLPSSSSDLQDEVTRLQQQTVSLWEAIRHLSHELHPGVLQLSGLVAALRAHCDEFGRLHDLELQFHTEGDLAGVPEEVALCLYRVAQEALHNIATHADASHVEVTLSRTAAGLELVIRDDGMGFDPEAAGRRGLGLISMDERVRMVQGTVQIVSQKQRGTELRVHVPPAAPRSPSQDRERTAPASGV